MLKDNKIWIAQGDNPCYLLLNQANRHGLIAGASGTGKTVTLKVIAEGFSDAGVPVFMADVKGDVTGMAQAGELTDNLRERMGRFGIAEQEFAFRGTPCRIWDMLGGAGCPVRVTISDMGPQLLSRLLGLTEVQQGVLNIVFRVADDQQLLLLDLKDLRAMLTYVSQHAKEYETTYGRVSSQSVGAIQRALIAVEDQGGNVFFGEPNLDIEDWFVCDANGRGYVNILNAAELVNMPLIYSMFLLWMLSTLFERLPEVGDLDKPRFVFFFDEAHLLFNGMPKQLVDKVVQVVKLIRSKGVGVYFITQSPSDIPNEVLAQLSNRVQHGLRAYTPAEQKAVRAAAASFRANPAFDSVQALQEVGTGEALVSFLDEGGRPSIVERARVLFPGCRMAAADPGIVSSVIANQYELMSKYEEAVDRESAFELIEQARVEADAAARLAAERAAFEKEKAAFEAQKAKEEAAAAARAEREAERQRIAEEKEAERQRIAEEKEAERRRIAAEKEAERQRLAAEKEAERLRLKAEKEADRLRLKEEKEAEKREADAKRARDRVVGNIFNSVVGTIGREAGRQITRGIFGTKR
jgi:DNA helicase HerA-like ATPase